MDTLTPKSGSALEIRVELNDRIEIPCKDLDLDCLPDKNGDIPFGNYALCHAYDRKQGTCPFVPLNR